MQSFSITLLNIGYHKFGADGPCAIKIAPTSEQYSRSRNNFWSSETL